MLNSVRIIKRMYLYIMLQLRKKKPVYYNVQNNQSSHETNAAPLLQYYSILQSLSLVLFQYNC